MGRPIELISPAGASHSRGGGLPARGSSVIVLETKALNGKASQQRVAEGAAGGDRVEGARAVDDRVGELEAAEGDRAHAQCAGTAASRAASTTGPVDADPQVAALADGHDAAVAGAEAAGHPRLERELGAARRASAHSARTASSIAGGPQA